jgi:hypothetical protein
MLHLKKEEEVRSVHAFNEYNRERMIEIIHWCKDNCKGHWYLLNDYQLCLKDNDDALLFKLIWFT